MKSLAKILKPAKILFPLIFGALLLSNPAKAQKISFLKEFNFGFTYYKEKIKIENIPLEIRNVPKHPNDYYIPNENVAPIDDEKIKLPYNQACIFDLKLGVSSEILENKLHFNIGTDFNIGIPPLVNEYLKERNYNTHPGTQEKGYGACLTYYKFWNEQITSIYIPSSEGLTNLLFWTALIKPKIFSEFKIKGKDNEEIVLGYEVFIERLFAQNGWDRYGGGERMNNYNLANLFIGSPYLVINVPEKKVNSSESAIDSYKTGIIVGFTYPIRTSKKPIAKEMIIQPEVGWFLGFRWMPHFKKNKKSK